MTYRKTPFKMVIKTRFIIYLLRKDSNKKGAVAVQQFLFEYEVCSF